MKKMLELSFRVLQSFSKGGREISSSQVMRSLGPPRFMAGLEMTKYFLAVSLFMFIGIFMMTADEVSAFQASPADAAKRILIQHNGRVKSFDAFSRQMVEFITGRSRWNRQPAVVTVLNVLSKGEAAKNIQWIRLDYKELAATLGLPADRHTFSYNEILPSVAKIEKLVQNARQKRDQDLRPTKLEQKAETLYSALIETSVLISGEIVRVIPAATQDAAWRSPYEVSSSQGDAFKQIVGDFEKKNDSGFKQKVSQWISDVDRLTENAYRNKTDLEVHYLALRPFEWSWIAYLLSFILISFFKKTSRMRPAGIGFLALAMAFHTYGLVLRVLILSRPPVSNMYESLVFMNWVLMAAAAVFALARKQSSPASIGALVSAVIMIYGDLLPIDTSLDVLAPVLRSAYWLTIHVLTIVASYGVLGLAMGLGHRHLILELRKKLSKAESERSGHLINRVIQVGVLLLGIGTVLGGVWANESWGRFWGWDPKETWALITFLGYLIVVHLKFSKKMSDWWLAMSSVLGFLLVLMTWYGVNFVLGRGLHSYGQGAGGMVWVILYLILEALFVAYAFFHRLKGTAI